MEDLLLAVEDSKGEIFTIPSNTGQCILEVHYCTSYYTFVVQEQKINAEGETIYPTKEIFVELKNSNWVDLIALEGEERGKIVSLK